MSFTQSSNRSLKQGGADAKPGAISKAIRSAPEIDKVMALAILAASAIFAPVAMAILHQAAQIFAR